MKIMIFGSAGFIGTNIASKALSRGHSIVAIDNIKRRGVESNILRHKNYQFIHGDVRCKEDFDFFPKDIDGIINLAANPGIPWSIENPVYDFNSNCAGALNVLEFAKNNGKIPVVFASTNKIYSEAVNKIDVVPYTPTDKTTGKQMRSDATRYVYKDEYWKDGIPEEFYMDGQGKFAHSPYGCSKAGADLYHQEYYHCFGVPTVINRMSCIYGKYQFGVSDQGWVSWFMIAKILGKPLTIYGDGLQVRDALYAEDLADLYLMELENINVHKGNVYNVGGGPKNTVSIKEAIELINILDKGEHKPFEISYQPWRHADHKVYISNINKVSKYWKPKTTVFNGFSKTYQWIKNNKDLIRRFYEM